MSTNRPTRSKKIQPSKPVRVQQQKKEPCSTIVDKNIRAVSISFDEKVTLVNTVNILRQYGVDINKTVYYYPAG